MRSGHSSSAVCGRPVRVNKSPRCRCPGLLLRPFSGYSSGGRCVGFDYAFHLRHGASSAMGSTTPPLTAKVLTSPWPAGGVVSRDIRRNHAMQTEMLASPATGRVALRYYSIVPILESVRLGVLQLRLSLRDHDDGKRCIKYQWRPTTTTQTFFQINLHRRNPVALNLLWATALPLNSARQAV